LGLGKEDPEVDPREVNLDEVDRCEREWGVWRVIEDGNGYKIKVIWISPEKSISLQFHNERDEMWSVAKGAGVLRVGDTYMQLVAGDTVTIPKKAVHKVWCTSDEEMMIVEVQLGKCSEYDIVRLPEEE
jgi:mannose-6-phosphate isomerase